MTRRILYAVIFLSFGFFPKHSFALISSKDTIDFGKIKIGFQRQNSAIITNDALTTIDISDIRIITMISVPSEFTFISVLSVPLTLPSGVGRQIILRCKPIAVGLRTAILRMVTTNGDSLLVVLKVDGSTIQPDITIDPPIIDFGIRLPGQVIDTTFIVKSIGPDSATIQNYSVANDNGAIYFDIVPDDPTIQLPVVLTVGKSMKFHAHFNTSLAQKSYTGHAEMLGIVSDSTTCFFEGRVGLPDISVSPGILDFGVLPLGSSLDSVIVIKNSGEVSAHIQTISNPNAPFSLKNPPATFDIKPGDSVKIAVSVFAAKTGTFSAPIDILEKSPGVTGINKSMLLEARVVPQVLSATVTKTIDVACGLDSVYSFAYTLRDTGAYSIVVDGLNSTNTSLTIPGGVFPDSLHPSTIKSLQLQYHYDSTSFQDSLIVITVQAYGKPLLYDTINVRVISRNQPVVLQRSVINTSNKIVVKTAADIESYKLSTIRFLISISPSDVADLIYDSITTAIPAATMSLTNVGTGKYELLVTTKAPTFLSNFDSLFSFALKYYVASDSVATVIVETIADEKSGCLNFGADSVQVTTPTNCANDLLRAGLRNELLIDNFHFSANPISNTTLVPIFSLHKDASLRAEFYNSSGIGVKTVTYPQQSVSNEVQLPIDVSSLPMGAYYLRISATDLLGNCGAVSQPFIIQR